MLEELSDSESANTVVEFYSKVLQKPGTKAEIDGLSRLARRFPDTIDRAYSNIRRQDRQERMADCMMRNKVYNKVYTS